MPNLTKLLVKKILENPLAYDWELKGLGLIRTYLSEDTKIHIWDSRYKVPNVSITHEHPWSFESLIIAGKLRQYRLTAHGHEIEFSQRYWKSTVQCGPGGRLLAEPQAVNLFQHREEIYTEGETYTQAFNEIHQSYPADGTVTLITRLHYQPSRAAPVYWRDGEQWTSSEPVMATPDKIKDICQASLRRWFAEV